jgi:hypothetical protein
MVSLSSSGISRNPKCVVRAFREAEAEAEASDVGVGVTEGPEFGVGVVADEEVDEEDEAYRAGRAALLQVLLLLNALAVVASVIRDMLAAR